MVLSFNVIVVLQIMYIGCGVFVSDLNWWVIDGVNIIYVEVVVLFVSSFDVVIKYFFF